MGAGECFGSSGLNLGDPPSDELRICAGFQRGAVSSELGVTFVDDVLSRHCGGIIVDVGLSAVEGLDGVGQLVWGKTGAQPLV